MLAADVGGGGAAPSAGSGAGMAPRRSLRSRAAHSEQVAGLRASIPFSQHCLTQARGMDVVIGVSGSGDVSALCCDFGRDVPRVVSALSFKLKAETTISGDRASMQWRR